MVKTLHSLLKELDIDVTGLRDPLVKGMSCDSRLIKEGDLFFGFSGSNFDGGNFWQNALSKGAAAVVLSSSLRFSIPKSQKSRIVFVNDPVAYWMGEMAAVFWEMPSLKMNLIGVTGTNGKTTTTHLIEYLSEKSGTSSSLFGTLVNRWPNHSEVAIQTTRFSHILHAQLSEAVSSGARLGAMEVSSHALDQNRVAGLRFSGAVFTNLTQDHLDYHDSMNSYFEAKTRLFEEPLLQPGKARAIVNIDNEWGERLAGRLKGICWRSSLDNTLVKSHQAELFITDIQYESHWTSGIIHTPVGNSLFRSPLIGAFNMMNVLQAIGVLIQRGFKLDDLVASIEEFPGVPGRMELVRPMKIGDDSKLPKVLVDYAHTPDGLTNALTASRPFTRKSLICVFGCGGDRDRGKRSQMGAIASQLADKVIITSDNPRTEDPNNILNDITSGIPTECELIIEPNRAKAIEIAIEMATFEDVVIIAGKGHEDYQIIGYEKNFFDDREVAKHILEEKCC